MEKWKYLTLLNIGYDVVYLAANGINKYDLECLQSANWKNL
jgi:hypothetical protein